MRLQMRPISLAVLGLFLSVSNIQKNAVAADHTGPIKLSTNPGDSSSYVLSAGDTYTFNGVGSAIEVGQGARFISTGAALSIQGVGTSLLRGLHLIGGHAEITGGSLTAIGYEPSLLLSGASLLKVTDATFHITRAANGYPNPRSALEVSGASTATFSGVNFISDTSGRFPHKAFYVTGMGSQLDFSDGSITADATLVHVTSGGHASLRNTQLTGGMTEAVLVEFDPSKLVLDNVTYKSAYQIDGVALTYGGNVDILNSHFETAGDGLNIKNDSSGSKVNITNTTIKIVGDDIAPSAGISVGTNTSARVDLKKVDISAIGSSIFMADQYSYLTGDQVSLSSTHSPTLKISAGEATLSNSTINVANSSNSRVSAVYAGVGGVKAHFNAIDTDINATGSYALALEIGREGSALVKGGAITATDGSSGALVSASGKLALEGTQLRSNQTGVQALTSVNRMPTLEISKGTSIHAATALMLSNSLAAEMRIPISDSELVSTGAGGVIQANTGGGGSIHIDVNRSRLVGAVNASNADLELKLDDTSTLSGQIKGPRTTLHLGDNSRWDVVGSSTLQLLNNSAGTGVITLMPGAPGEDHKTISVRDYMGGGQLIINTRIGSDDSPTDKVVIDGGKAVGSSSLKVLNVGGQGAITTQGIAVVQTLNGATSTSDLLWLHPESSGYRASAKTLAVNGYDYSLIRGGAGAVEDSWYLASVVSTEPQPEPEPKPEPKPEPEPTPEPGLGPEPEPTPTPKPTPEPIPKLVTRTPSPKSINVSPETGAFIGNQLAATQMLTLSLSDREIARTAITDTPDDSRKLAFWSRVKASHDTGLEFRQGDLAIESDSYLLQLGSDVWRKDVGEKGSFVTGLMGSYGDSRVDSTSYLKGIDQAGALTTTASRARGKVRGYALGLYATWFADRHSKMGAYADSWVQFGRYSNKISSELGSASYHANVWGISLESGYAFRPSSARTLVIEPQVQVSYSHYSADDAELSNTTLSSGNSARVDTRAGVRFYPLGKLTEQASLRPYAEVNWLYRSGTPSVHASVNEFLAKPLRHAAELKVGAEGRVARSLYVAGQVSGYTGSGNQHGYAGRLNLNYRW